MCDQKIVMVATYGTLMTGGRLCREEYILCKSMDKIKGSLFRVGGETFDFPALILEGEDLIDVEVQVVPREYLEYMDAVEGSLYTKRQVVTEGGTPVIVYEWGGSVRFLESIKEWKNN